MVLGFSILSASIASSVVRDRVTGAKRLQHISGLGYRTYWFTNFLYDMVGFWGNAPRAPRRDLSVCGVFFWRGCCGGRVHLYMEERIILAAMCFLLSHLSISRSGRLHKTAG